MRRLMVAAFIVVLVTTYIIHVSEACQWAREVGHPAAKDIPCRIL